jgi:hypothetical protein
MIYQVHLLIFLFAVVHVFYVWGTLMLTLFQMSIWHQWETEAPNSEDFLAIADHASIPPKHLKGLKHLRHDSKTLWRRVGTNHFSHIFRVATGVITRDLVFCPVNRAIYYGLRLMFINRLSLDHSFDFSNFVER